MFKNIGISILTQRIAFKASPPWLLPILVFSIIESLFLILKILGLNIHGPVIPMSFGLIKDLADVVLVVLFPWHGWVFAIPLLVIFARDISSKYLLIIYLLSTISTALISSIFNFSHLSFEKIVSSILTYATINIFVFLFLFSLKSMIKGVLKCRQ